MKIRQVTSMDGWEAVYVDGEKIASNSHALQTYTHIILDRIARRAGFDFKAISVEPGWRFYGDVEDLG